MAIYHEDGWVAEVEVLEDKSDKDWYRYNLKVLNTLRDSKFMKTPPDGHVFRVEQVTKGGWAGMWHLTDYAPADKERGEANG